MSNLWDAQTLKTPRRVVHCIAQCRNCEWSDDAFKTAARNASRHAHENRHQVLVEHGITYTVMPS